MKALKACFINAVALLLFAIFALTPMGLMAAENGQWWQLTIHYSATSVTIVSAQPFDPPAKQVRTPGLQGAPLQLDFDATWLDASRRGLYQTTTTLPVGWRATIDTPGPQQTFIPDSGLAVIRMRGPKPSASATALKLSRTAVRARGVQMDTAPPALQTPVLMMDLPAATFQTPPPGPISATKVRDTGPDSNRLVIAVLGDGYTSASLSGGLFTQHTNLLLSSFTQKSPFDIYFNATNVYRIDVESTEAGADEPPPGPGIYRDTYLNSSFWTGGTERLLTINYTGQTRAIAAANSLIGVGVWDDIFVLVNSTKYGGAGGSISVSSVHPSANEIILHEYGHTFAGLADEYDYGSSSPPSSDKEPNVDFQYDRALLKWNYWVDEDTPLPTPVTGNGNKVGAFLGAKYSTTGIYRPWANCLMRTLGVPFCPVCKEAVALEYTGMLNLIESKSPAANAVEVTPGGINFAVQALPIIPLVYTWTLNGNPLPSADSNSVKILPAQIDSPSQVLTVTVSHPTSLIRKSQVLKQASWTVTPAMAGIEPGVWMKY